LIVVRGEQIGLRRLGQDFGFFGFAILLKAQEFGHFLFAAAGEAGFLNLSVPSGLRH
jgi:hypothetical protein